MNLEHKIKLSYPLPICKMYESVQLEYENRHRVRRLIDLVEGVTKYLALIGLLHYLRFGLVDENINKIRQKEFSKPSFGSWVGLYRGLSTLFERTDQGILFTPQTEYKKDEPLVSAIKSLRKVTGSQAKTKQFTQFTFLDAIVEIRNEKHG